MRRSVQGIEGDNCEVVWNSLDVEPTALVERVFLNFGNKRSPDVKVSTCPEVWTLVEDVVRQDVIVAKGRNHRHDEVIGRIVVRLVLILCKDLVELFDEQLI